MKNRTIRIFAAALALVALAFTGSALAQPGGEGRHGGKHKQQWSQMTEQEKQEMMNKRLDRRVDKMTENLDLTDQQAEQLRKALQQKFTQRQALRQKHRQEMKALHQKTKTQIEGILTDEQEQKLEQVRQERRQRRLERGTERLSDKLGLTDDQQAQVEAILSELQTDVHQLRQDDTLEGKQKRQQARQLFQEATGDIEALLDETQTAEFQKVKHRLRHKLMRGK